MRRWLTLSTVALLTCACSGGNNEDPIVINNQQQPDTGEENSTTTDMGDGADIPTFGDVGNPNNGTNGCHVAEALIDAWPLNDAVASGDVTATDNAGTWTATIDAAAGGTAAAANNPFVYLDLDGAAKVAVTDYEAIESDETWEIAFRRTAAFTNSGDAGPGAVQIARLTGVDFDAVTAADIPADGSFVTEDPVNEECEVAAPASGFGSVSSVFETLNPDTTSGSWYNYGMGATGPSVTAYADHVYIVRGTDMGSTFKFGFVSWTSGVIEVRWAALQ